MNLALLLLIPAFLGCAKKKEVTYTQFNGSDDSMTIDVGVPTLEPANSIDLTSTTGQVIIGQATVDPGGGPIGTDHAIVVNVDDAYQQIVDRVSVRLKSPQRGVDEFEMQQDSADEGVWKLDIVSTGTADEVRTDTLTVRCWDRSADTGGASGSSSHNDDSGS